MHQKRVAISGASGLIGSALVRELCQTPVELLLLRRSSSQSSIGGRTQVPGSTSNAARFEDIDWDPKRGVTQVEQLEDLDAIIHLAGRSINAARWTDAEKARLRDSRVLATERLVGQIEQLERKPRVFVGASAVGIYGDCGPDWLAEGRPASADFLGSLANDWERALMPLQSSGVRVVHARFGVVLSPQGGALQKMLPIFRSGLGGRLGSGKQYMSWIALEDCTQALQFLMNHETAVGPYNLVSPNPVTNQELTSALGRVLHRPVLLPAPAFALKILLGEMADALLMSSQRASAQKLLDLGFPFQHPDLESYLRSVLPS